VGLRNRVLLGLDLLSSGLLSVAFPGYDGDSGVVGEPVEGCGGQQRIAKDLRPFRRGAVGCEYCACPLVSRVYYLVEIVGSGCVQFGSESFRSGSDVS
jgi:hypothetical protein